MELDKTMEQPGCTDYGYVLGSLSLWMDVERADTRFDSRFDPRQQPPRFQVCRDALGHEAGVLHRRKVRRGLAKGDDARRGARQVRREEVAVEGGPRPTWLGLGLG